MAVAVYVCVSTEWDGEAHASGWFANWIGLHDGRRGLPGLIRVQAKSERSKSFCSGRSEGNDRVCMHGQPCIAANSVLWQTLGMPA